MFVKRSTYRTLPKSGSLHFAVNWKLYFSCLDLLFSCISLIYLRMRSFVLVICAVFTVATAFEKSDIVSARIETCRGCSLNRLPQVKQFVMSDAPKYERVQVEFISGAPPELVLLGDGDQELQRLSLSQLDRDQCNALLQEHGFIKSAKNSEF